MVNIIVPPNGLRRPHLAESLFPDVGPEFVPNLVFGLHWPQPLWRADARQEARFFLGMFAALREHKMMQRRCRALPDAPYVLAVNRLGDVSDCLIWTDYEEDKIDKSRIEQLPLIWECLVGGRAEVTIGREPALHVLTQTYEGQKPERMGELLFSTHRVWEWSEYLD